jgi:hypothetical protein
MQEDLARMERVSHHTANVLIRACKRQSIIASRFCAQVRHGVQVAVDEGRKPRTGELVVVDGSFAVHVREAAAVVPA